MQVLGAEDKGDEQAAWMILALKNQKAAEATVGLGLNLCHLEWEQTDWIQLLSTLAMG